MGSLLNYLGPHAINLNIKVGILNGQHSIIIIYIKIILPDWPGTGYSEQDTGASKANKLSGGGSAPVLGRAFKQWT